MNSSAGGKWQNEPDLNAEAASRSTHILFVDGMRVLRHAQGYPWQREGLWQRSLLKRALETGLLN